VGCGGAQTQLAQDGKELESRCRQQLLVLLVLLLLLLRLAVLPLWFGTPHQR
jgi:hypothetical protein